MMIPSRPSSTNAARKSALALAFVLPLLAMLLAVFPPGEAVAKSGKRVVLGKSKYNPIPNCGLDSVDRDCSVEGKVTVFQSLRGGHPGRSFVVPFKKGKVVSWSISLSRPTRQQTQAAGNPQTPFFNQLFGSPAKARISVLRQVRKRRKGPPQYRMVRQSPVQILNPFFGKTVYFALTKPLNVIQNQVVALTIPTWAPAFWTPRACSASPLGGLVDPTGCDRAKRANTYRASRGRNKCKLGFEPGTDRPNEALRKTGPQQKVNSIRGYACYYTGSRLLYNATVVAR